MVLSSNVRDQDKDRVAVSIDNLIIPALFSSTSNRYGCTNENSSSFIVTCCTNSSFESHEAKFHRQPKLIFIYLLIFRQKNLLRRVILKRKLLEIGSAASCAKLIQDRRSFTLSVSKIETSSPSELNIYISRKR